MCHFCCSSWLFRSQFRSLQLLYINQSVFLIALSAIMLNKNELPLVLRSIHGHCKSYGQENNNRCGKYWPLTDLLPLYLFNCRYCYHNLLQPDENRVERLAVLLCYGSLIFLPYHSKPIIVEQQQFLWSSISWSISSAHRLTQSFNFIVNG